MVWKGRKKWGRRKLWGRRKFRRGQRRRGGKHLAKRVRRIEKSIETKYNDYQIASSAISTAGAVFGIGYPTKGTGVSNRVGNEFFMTSLDIRYEWKIQPGTTADNYNRVRTIFGYVKDPNAAGLPTMGEILDNTYDFMLAGRSWDDRKLIRVFYDKTETLYYAQDGTGKATGIIHQIIRSKFFKPHKTVTFNTGNAGSANDIQKNLFFIAVVSDSGLVDHPLFTAVIRQKFKDG